MRDCAYQSNARSQMRAEDLAAFDEAADSPERRRTDEHHAAYR